MSETPRVSVAIPLFRSARFVDNVSANVEEMPEDVEILISDRHGHDDAIDQLETRHRGDSRLRFLRSTNGENWVGHLNVLLREARGEYWRFQPHDDFCARDSHAALVSCLEEHPETVLTYGPTQAVDLDGEALPEKHDLEPHPIYNDDAWRLGLLLDSLDRGHFNGSFKGLIRRSEVVKRGLWIRQTHEAIYAERIWLSALGLVGRFRFVQGATYEKRYYSGSTSSYWRFKPIHELSAHKNFLNYCRALLPGRNLYRRVRAYTVWTTMMRLGWLDRPVNLPATEPFLPKGNDRIWDRVRRDWRGLHGLALDEDGNWQSD